MRMPGRGMAIILVLALIIALTAIPSGLPQSSRLAVAHPAVGQQAARSRPIPADVLSATATVPTGTVPPATLTAAAQATGTALAATLTAFADLVQPNSIAVSPNSAPVGQNVLVTGKGFTPNGSIGVTIGGAYAPIVSGNVADSGGNVSVLVTVPSLATNYYAVVVKDNASGQTASYNQFYVTGTLGSPTATSTPVGGSGNLAASPNNGPPSIAGGTPTTITLNGYNLPANTQVTGLYLVDGNGHAISLSPSVTSTTSAGTYSATVTLPGQAAGGAGSIELIVGSTVATTTFTVTPTFLINGHPATSTSPAQVLAGQSIQITGAGFKANTIINFLINISTTLPTNPTAVATDAYGNLSASAVIPTNLTTGTYYITSQDQSGNEQVIAFVTITSTPVPITVQGVTLQTAVNAALNNVTIGSFTDSAGLPASSYTTAISWGDGTPSGAANRARDLGSGSMHPAGVSEQYTITGSHTYSSVGIFPINVTIQAADGRTAYLTSIAQVGAAAAAVTYQVQAGWNLIGPQLPSDTTAQASAVATAIMNASGGDLVALYGLTGGGWSPSYIDIRGSQPSQPDFTLRGGQGYLVYSDKPASFAIGSAATRAAAVQRGRNAIHAGLTSAQRRHLPPVPQLP